MRNVAVQQDEENVQRQCRVVQVSQLIQTEAALLLKPYSPCRRGKKQQKHYTVMVCQVDAAARAAFQPQLNSEHREARWWPLQGLPPPQQLHPVVVGPCMSKTHSCRIAATNIVPDPAGRADLAAVDTRCGAGACGALRGKARPYPAQALRSLDCRHSQAKQCLPSRWGESPCSMIGVCNNAFWASASVSALCCCQGGQRAHGLTCIANRRTFTPTRFCLRELQATL